MDAIACDDGACDTGYGNAADGSCGGTLTLHHVDRILNILSSVTKSNFAFSSPECPSNCDDCSMTGETDDETLHCDTCTDGYVLNDDVCGGNQEFISLMHFKIKVLFMQFH